MTDDQQRDPKLTRLYGASVNEEPSLQTDAAIKRLAREGLPERRARSSVFNPSVWAMAASVVLGATVLLQWPEPLNEDQAVMPAELGEPVPEALFQADEAAPEPLPAPAMRMAPMAPPATAPLAPPELERRRAEAAADRAAERRVQQQQQRQKKQQQEQRQRKALADAACDRWVPAPVEDKSAWRLQLEQLRASGQIGQAECLEAMYVERFGTLP